MIDLPIWECLYRIRVLNQFISHLAGYENHSDNFRRSRDSSYPSDKDGSESRKSINLLTLKVSKYLREAGIYPIMNYREPPIIGGRVFPNIDVIQNLFTIPDFDMTKSMAIDLSQKAIGYYQDDLLKSFFRTINPFWWLWKLVVSIIRIPFSIVDWAGFDSNKLESSSGGKLYKTIAGITVFIVGSVTFLASIVQILDSFGLIQSVKDFFQNLFK